MCIIHLCLASAGNTTNFLSGDDIQTCVEACLELLFKACDVSIRNGGTQSVGGYTQVTC